MLEKETECAAVLQQIVAIRAAFNGLMAEVLQGHPREHLGPDEKRSHDVEQLVAVLRSCLNNLNTLHSTLWPAD